jgi:hypothetical protein
MVKTGERAMHDTTLDIQMRIRDTDAKLRRFERRTVVVGTSISAVLMLVFVSFLAVIGVPL